MKIKPAIPPNTTSRYNWKPFVDTLTNSAPGEWFSVPLLDLPGANRSQRQSRICNAANRYGFSITTRVEGDLLFFATVEKRSK